MVTARMSTQGIVSAFVLASAGHVAAQTTAPIAVTPSTLRPIESTGGPQVNIPETARLVPPAGAELLTVTLDAVRVEGGFPEVAAETDALTAPLRSQTVTLAQIYEVASKIEAAHVRAGFILARVAVPPQDLRRGSTLRIVVVDGFIGDIDALAVPTRVRRAVEARVRPLRRRQHLRLADIEAPLLIANTVPGLTLHSTLTRGSELGSTLLVLDATHQLVSGSIAGDNQLDPSLGRWGVTGQVAINSFLGLGEQFYGFLSTGYDARRTFASDVRERVMGGGITVPFGEGRFSLNPEVTFSRTQPAPLPGAPTSVGDLRRLTLRAAYVAQRTRRTTIGLTGTVEQIAETNKIPTFGVEISRDRYLAARLGMSVDRLPGDGTVYGMTAQLSQGLGDLAGISVADTVATGVPFSRQGSAPDFTKLSVQLRASAPLGNAFGVSVSAKGQTTFNAPVFRAEQFVLEGSDGVSAYGGGGTAADEGAVVRTELRGNFSLGGGQAMIDMTPYVFAASGLGSIAKPTALEPASLRVAAFGAGLRAALLRRRLFLEFEYAHGMSDLARFDNVNRGNVSITVRL